ncbi:hypothetical protein Ddye_001891 [Dipteronia dyeriana]|uniref:HAT C-terminal dimerisation domain-containing protein n=1 Tax=Dipteronia dyeriana TaxID=168575 RepID=A0AAD9XQ46_9ROSI|nr:hypothetical protein Ddye_001891 [Dipteronia dyeriana]
MATQMYNKFNKYWTDFSTILAIVIVLDPRYKMEFVEFVYDRLYGEESEKLVVLKTKLHALFNEYVSNSTRPTRPSTLRTQLDLYLKERRLERSSELNILHFWKGNEPRYPELAAMACDILSIPISTVASKSAFSIGCRVIGEYRTSLNPNVVEATVCTQDWLNGGSSIMKCEEITRVMFDMDNNNVDAETFESTDLGTYPKFGF